MEIEPELYSTQNKQNALRKRISNGNANTIQTLRPCLADITHKFVPNKSSIPVSKNIGLFKLATGHKTGNGSLRSALPR